MLLIPAQVVWVEIWPGVITGIGVKFLALNPSEDALIGAVVDRLLGETSPSLDSS
jgi:hypothetical protein